LTGSGQSVIACCSSSQLLASPQMSSTVCSSQDRRWGWSPVGGRAWGGGRGGGGPPGLVVAQPTELGCPSGLHTPQPPGPTLRLCLRCHAGLCSSYHHRPLQPPGVVALPPTLASRERAMMALTAASSGRLMYQNGEYCASSGSAALMDERPPRRQCAASGSWACGQAGRR
jgi:hypothetical protein